MIFRIQNKSVFLLVYCAVFLSMKAQQTSLKGVVFDELSQDPVVDVLVSIAGTDFLTKTDTNGAFLLKDELPLGEQLLMLHKSGYHTTRLPIVINKGESLVLEHLNLRHDFSSIAQGITVISLSEEAFDEDTEAGSDAAGLLQASKDVFLKAAAFDWSSTFFRPRGYDSSQGKVLINGVQMNKIYTGRPQWSNWGGLNEVIRNQEFSRNSAASDLVFGGIAGTTAIQMRASRYRSGGQVSYGLSNRSYIGRIMGTYHSGAMKNGWAYSFSLSRRYGDQGAIEGTLYDANAAFAAIEKQLGAAHSLSLVAFYAPNTRGKSAPNTQEVWDLKGSVYNPYWGYQNGRIRNARIRRIEEPVAILNHFWKWKEGRMELQNTLAVQSGNSGNSRLSYGGTALVSTPTGQLFFEGNGSNPDPTYYQKLPSYFLRFPEMPNYKNAYLATQNFQDNGQLDWGALYQANQGALSSYVLYEDRTDDTKISAGSVFRGIFNRHFTLNTSLNFRSLYSENYATILDLLGGTGFLDIDSFAEGNTAQNDLQNPNRIVGEGDKFQYHYGLTAKIGEAFTQGQFKYDRVRFFIAGIASQTYYKRKGYFENGNAPGVKSRGESASINFTDFGIKGGLTYVLKPKHFLQFHGVYQTEAPILRNVFTNVRQENTAILKLKSQNTQSISFGYRLQSSKIQTSFTGYYTRISDATNLNFFYTDALASLGAENNAAFVQEILIGLDKRYLGVELGVEVPLNSTFKLKTAAAVGHYTYANNPTLYLTSNNFADPLVLGVSTLKDYHISGGPQRAFSFGFEYRDPNYWWLSSSANYFSNTYVAVSPFTRTKNFYTDTDGLPFANYDSNKAKELLRQEKFAPYMLVNLVGGKSWRIKNYYIGFVAGVSNLLNAKYKTGGFEQARNANYQGLLAENQRKTPVFGAKYWQGLGATYFTNFYIRF